MLIVQFDRFLIAFALSVHIILASIGIALPVIILFAEFIGIKYKDQNYIVLAKRLSIVFVILFAIGTASGTFVALSLFLLWPKFFALIGQVAILPFYLESFAFFLESIFLGIYFYSWDKFKGRYSHLLSGIPIAVGAALSGILITMINAFMNTPVGFDIPTYLKTGMITNVNPFAVFNTPSTWIEVSHVMSSSYFAGTLVFISYVAYMLLKTKKENVKEREYYIKWLKLMLVIGAIATVLSIGTGLLSIKSLVTLQPEKYAAIEANLNPQAYAPERIGGIFDNSTNTLKYYIPLPNLQSILATGSPSGTVPGLSSYPRSTWPPLIIHDMFDIMVFLGVIVGLIFAYTLLKYILDKNSLSNSRLVLWLLVISGALSLILLEDGWVLAELGRQPWIIYNVMLVSTAANYSLSVLPVTILILLFYIFAIPFTILIIKRIFKSRPLENELIS